MASIAFRVGESADWTAVKPQIQQMVTGLDGFVDDLENPGLDHAVVSPYGDMGMFLAEMPEKISTLVQGWTVFCTCVDSDFALLELYHNGEELDCCAVGEVYEEYEEFCTVTPPKVDVWARLLVNPQDLATLEQALLGQEVFVEDQLRALSKLTGLKIFDDGLVFGQE